MRWTLILVLALFAGACGGDDDGRTGLFDRDLPDASDDADGSGGDDPAPADADPDDEPAATGDDRSGELVGTWTVTFYALPDGGGMTNVVGGNSPVQITFDADGTLDYHTGCNQGSGDYSTSGTYYVPDSALDDEPEGQAISLGPGAQTEIGCPGFLGEQDVDLPAAMRQAVRFRLDGERLILSAEFFLVEAERA